MEIRVCILGRLDLGFCLFILPGNVPPAATCCSIGKVETMARATAIWVSNGDVDAVLSGFDRGVQLAEDIESLRRRGRFFAAARVLLHFSNASGLKRFFQA